MDPSFFFSCSYFLKRVKSFSFWFARDVWLVDVCVRFSMDCDEHGVFIFNDVFVCVFLRWTVYIPTLGQIPIFTVGRLFPKQYNSTIYLSDHINLLLDK